MPTDQVRQLLSEVRPRHVNLTGFGEPTLHPEFIEIVSEIKRRPGIHLRFFTNGLLLTQESIAMLVRERVDFIIVSIDSFDRQTYFQRRGRDCFGTVIDQLQALVEEKRRQAAQLPEVWTNFVLTRDSVKDLLPYIEGTARELTGVTPHVELIDLTGFRDEVNAMLPTLEQEELIEAARERALIHGFKPTSEMLAYIKKRLQQWHSDGKLTSSAPCYYAGRNLTVQADGGVVPCQFYFERQVTFGNVFTEAAETIWESNSYSAMREQLWISRAAVPYCQDCTFDCCGKCSSGAMPQIRLETK